MALTWAQALAWRSQRQLLDPVGTGSVVDVVARLGAVPGWPEATTELAIGARRTGGAFGDAARALEAGSLVKAFTFRGGTHLMTPQDAGAYLAVRASSRMWELPSWQSYYRLAPSDWPRFRAYVRRALAGGALTRSELAAALGRSSRYRHLGVVVTEGNDTLLKPLTWQGDMGMGPIRAGEATFLPLGEVPGWAGIPDLDDAGPALIAAHLRTYGPATADQIHTRFGEGLGAKRRAVTRWLNLLEERFAMATIDGERVLVLREDLDALMTMPPSTAVRLLPARDPWVMATGTADEHVVPPARREAVSRSANLVVRGGVVSGTWRLRGDVLEVAWFTESGRVPGAAMDQEVEGLTRFLDRPLRLTLTVA